MLIKKNMCIIGSIIAHSLAGLCITLCVYLCIHLNDKPSDITVIGQTDYADGIARQSIDALVMLDTPDISSNLITFDNKKAILPESLRSLLAKNKTRSFLGKVVLYEDVLQPKDNINYAHIKNSIRTTFSKLLSYLKGKKRSDQIWYSYSMYETTAIHPNWVETINRDFDAVLVPDKFLINVYKNSGVTKPVFLLPLPVDMKHLLSRPIKAERNKVFTFMSLSTGLDRKNNISLIMAFDRLFHNNPNVRLVLNMRYSHPKYKKLLITYIKENNITNIVMTQKRLTKEQYADLLSSADCYVNLSKGEGFSVQPREAIALGIPVIISNNTAQKTIADSGLALPVKSDFMAPSENDGIARFCGYDFETHPDDIVAALKEMYENYDYYLKQSEARRKWVQKYTHKAVAPLYRTMAKPQKITLGDVNEINANGQLITNDESFYQHLCHNFHDQCLK